MIRLIGISGSLRADSFNTKLLRNAATLVPGDTELQVSTIRGIPLFDADLEAAEGIPEAVRKLKDDIAAADGLLLVTPEYNNSLPGPMKNAVDWLSRPPSDIPRVFHDKPVAIAGATPGGFGTNLSQTAWLPVLRALRTRPWFGERLQVSRARAVFDEAGNLTDESTKEQLHKFLAGFIAFVRAAA